MLTRHSLVRTCDTLNIELLMYPQSRRQSYTKPRNIPVISIPAKPKQIKREKESIAMQFILAIFNKALRQSIVVVGLMALISLSNVFFFVEPSYAIGFTSEKPAFPGQKLTPEEKIGRAYEYDPGVGVQEEDREQEYEQAVKDSENLETVEKAYERNEKAYEQQNPQPNLIQKAEKAIEKATGK